MNSFNYDHNSVDTQEEEASAIAPDTRLLRSMGKGFRTINLCIALFFLLWVLMLRLPFAVRILGELLRRLLLLLLPLTPLIISLIFGACVATVMVQSYHRLYSQNITEDNNVGANFYENTVNVGGGLLSTTAFHRRRQQDVEVVPYEAEEEVAYEDKEIVMSCDSDQSKTAPFSESDVRNELDVVEEDIKNQPVVEDGGGGGVLENEHSSPKDVLNDADFKRIIDSFIKRQRDFLKLENRCDYYGETHVYCY